MKLVWPGQVLILLALVSCAAPPDLQQRQAAADLGPGITLTLQQDLVLQSEKSRVYIQDGQVQSRDGLNFYEPYCYFFMYRRMNDLQGERLILKGDFQVISVWQRIENAAIPEQKPLQVAQVWDLSAVDLMTHIELLDARQVDVTELVCGRFASPSYGNFLTRHEIRETLSPLVKLR